MKRELKFCNGYLSLLYFCLLHIYVPLLYLELLAHFTCWSKARYVVFSRVSYIVCLVSPIVLNSVSSDHHFLPEFWPKIPKKYKLVWTSLDGKKIRNKQKMILGPKGSKKSSASRFGKIHSYLVTDRKTRFSNPAHLTSKIDNTFQSLSFFQSKYNLISCLFSTT